jgi:hypothetical protein
MNQIPLRRRLAGTIIILARVTSYVIDDNRLEPSTHSRSMEFWTHPDQNDRDLICHKRGPQCITVDNLRRLASDGEGWCAQEGVRPKCVDGQWCGRNHPAIFIEPHGVVQLLRWFDSL